MIMLDMKDKKISKKLLTIVVLITISPIIVTSVIIILYFRLFSGDFSDKQETWGQFGDLVGGILNPAISFYALLAAIIAIGYQLYEGKKTRTHSMYLIFESTFFKLIDIQSKKIEMLDYDGKKGMEVFSLLVNRFSEIYISKIEERFLIEKPAGFYVLVDEWLNLWGEIEKSNYGFECAEAVCANPRNNKFEIIRGILSKYNDFPAEKTIFLNVNKESKSNVLAIFIKENSFEHFIQDLKTSCDELYAERGNIYGHYFRNMSMLLDHIGSYDDNVGDKFAKLFRAQLSRSEIALLLINCVGSKSSDKFNQLVLRYDLTNGFENEDLIDGKRIHEYFKKIA